MRTRALVIFGFWLAAAAGPAGARTPVVVELFTSQGCASCIKAGDVMSNIAAKPHVVALTFDVDYWDYLGWTDSFAKPEFGDRQRAYLKPLGVRDVYTPQVVVDGRLEAAGVRNSPRPRRVWPSAKAGRRRAGPTSGWSATTRTTRPCRSGKARTRGARSLNIMSWRL